MKRSTPYGVLVLVAVAGLIGLGGAPANAETDPVGSINLTVDTATVHSGDTFTATATAVRTCAWTVEWNGDRRNRVSTEFTTTFVAPVVTETTRIVLQARCFYVPDAPPGDSPRRPARVEPEAGSGRSVGQRLAVNVPAGLSDSTGITVLPPGTVSPPDDGDHNGGGLPDTGGPALGLLVAALGALLLGIAAVGSGKRSDAAAG